MIYILICLFTCLYSKFKFLFVLSSFCVILYLNFFRVTSFSRMFLFIRSIRIMFLSFTSSRLSSSELYFGLGLYLGFSINFFLTIFYAYLLTQHHAINTIRYFFLIISNPDIILQQILSIN